MASTTKALAMSCQIRQAQFAYSFFFLLRRPSTSGEERCSLEHAFHKPHWWLVDNFRLVITKRGPCFSPLVLALFSGRAYLCTFTSSEHQCCFSMLRYLLPLSMTLYLWYLHCHSCCLSVPLATTKPKETMLRYFRQRQKDWFSFCVCVPLCHMAFNKVSWWVGYFWCLSSFLILFSI